MAKICKKCGSRNEDDMLFCTECGERLSEDAESADVRAGGISCPACGAFAASDDAFCTVCGHPLKGVPVSPPEDEPRRPELIIRLDPHRNVEDLPLDEHFHVPGEL